MRQLIFQMTNFTLRLAIAEQQFNFECFIAWLIQIVIIQFVLLVGEIDIVVAVGQANERIRRFDVCGYLIGQQHILFHEVPVTGEGFRRTRWVEKQRIFVEQALECVQRWMFRLEIQQKNWGVQNMFCLIVDGD